MEMVIVVETSHENMIPRAKDYVAESEHRIITDILMDVVVGRMWHAWLSFGMNLDRRCLNELDSPPSERASSSSGCDFLNSNNTYW